MSSSLEAIALRTEYLENPVGIDITQPRFYWKCRGGNRQTAYQIICTCEGKTIWDSGKVCAANMTHIPYEGEKLRSKMRVGWSVRLWNEEDIPGDWSKAFFEMGLLDQGDWKGRWITGDYSPKKTKRYPVDYFKKAFLVTGKIAKARLYITACGVYEAKIDDKRVGDFYLAPGSTDYRKRIQYQVYDVTEMISGPGVKELTIALADGWYRGGISAWGITSVYGTRTKLRCFLEMTCEDGTEDCVESDDSFSWSNDGPLTFADFKDGERYDARKKPSFSGKARIAAEEKTNLCASNNVIPKRQESFPASLITTPSGKKVLDFKQNIAGTIRFTVQGKEGQKIFMRFGEILDENGEFTQKNIQVMRDPGYMNTWKLLKFVVKAANNGNMELKKYTLSPLQELEFICSGGEDSYEMAFGLFGYRYALIETEVPFNPEDFQAVAVYSDMERTGDFSCSNEDVNQLFHNTLWSMKGNFLDVPTDCPTRERLGWTGDAQIFFETGSYMMNIAPFYRKYIRDMEDAQKKNGCVAAILPYSGADFAYNMTGTSVGWACALVLIPYRFHKLYGDDRIIETYYPMMKKYAEYMVSHSGPRDRKKHRDNPYAKYAYEKGFHLGEWLEPKEFGENVSKVPQTEVSTAYFAHIMEIMARVAEETGHYSDSLKYQEYAAGAKKCYEHQYLKEVPDTDRQAKLVRPLAFGLAEGETEQALANRLFQSVQNRNYSVSTGFLSTPFLLPTLTKYGRADLAYGMLENTNEPSWLYEVRQGATTVWENWDGDASRNHYSPGSVCSWLFSDVLGIRCRGERHFEVAPLPGGSFRFAEGYYDSLYGCVRCRWEKTEEGGTVEVEIPANTTATVCINGEKHEVSTGKYQFKLPACCSGKGTLSEG